ncbi:MAG TPA: hypothetical protein VGI86_04760 [Acidimicrobiia bacterium]
MSARLPVEAGVGGWRPLREALADEARLNAFRDIANRVSAQTSVLRMLDAAAWMLGSGSRHAGRARLAVGLSEASLYP